MKRPTLDSMPLSDRMAKKKPAAAALAAPVADAPAEERPIEAASRAAVTKDERVQILVRIDPAIRKKLKMIAVEQERTIQEICEEAIRDIVDRHSR